MAEWGVQKSEFTVLAPKPNYEFIVKSITEVPNDRGQFAYDPAKDNPNKATKLEWVFVGRKGTDAEGAVIKKRTAAYLTTDKRNGWHQMSRAVDSTFDPNVGYASMDDLQKRCVGRPVMLAISNTEKTVNGEQRIYNNIDNAYPSDQPALTGVELAELLTGGSVAGEDIPF